MVVVNSGAMAIPPAFDGARLLSWAQRSAAELERRRMEINELNVFPVPDSDTGSNMAHTMTAAVREAEKLGPGASAGEVAEALAVGSMRGARGNSGVVLSQVIRGVAHSIGDGDVTGGVIAEALSSGVQFVDRAISDPVEGTVVTVLRAAAEAAGLVREEPVATVVETACEAAREALRHTPSQLPALREAGVVDAGGTGLVILLEQLLREVSGAGGEPAELDSAMAAPSRDAGEESHGTHAHLEVMFFFDGDLGALEAALRALGADSIVIARGSETQGRVHAHTFAAGEVIEAAFSLGHVTELRLEVLPATAATGASAAVDGRLVVALTPPGSLAQLYSQAGAASVAPGGTAEETGEAIFAVVRESPASEVILLLNGLAGDDVGQGVDTRSRALGKAVTVVPTSSLAAGIAALAVHDPAQPAAEAAAAMAEAAGEMRTAVVRRGGEDAVASVAAAIARLLERGGELVSVLYDPSQLPDLEAELGSAGAGQPSGAEIRMYPVDGLGALAEIGVE